MSEAPKLNLKISTWKALKFALIVLAGKALTPDTMLEVVPPGVLDLTVGAILTALLNVLKVKFGWKW